MAKKTSKNSAKTAHPGKTGAMPRIIHHRDGSLYGRGEMLGGEMHGAWSFYRKDGSVMRSGSFDRGVQTGTWTTYASDGRIVKVTEMKPGRAARAKKSGDSKAASKIRFRAALLQPKAAGEAKADSKGWSFLKVPREASVKLPSRGMVSVEGTFNGSAFRATCEPDGEGGHWLKVERKLRVAAGVDVGDVVTLEISPVGAGEEPEPTVPPDLRKALAAAPGVGGTKAREAWSDITPVARRDWIQWITSGKRAETRVKRIDTACDMLAKGKRRPCCFDRSGMYGKSLSCPAADDASSGAE